MCSDTNFNTNFPTYWKQIIAVRIKLITHEQKLILLILFPHLHLQCITNADACINMMPYFHSIDSIWCHHIRSRCTSISTSLWFHDIYPRGINKQINLLSFARMLFLEFVPLHFVRRALTFSSSQRGIIFKIGKSVIKSRSISLTF